MPYEPLDFFNAGFAAFVERETEHILSGVAERNLCARLMQHLESVKERFEFGRYDLDPDMNRMNGQDVKYMLGEAGGRIRIECDLVVHRRAEADNLIALEMKKSRARKADKDDDRTRLRILTLPRDRAREAVFPVGGTGRLPYVSGYELGLFLVLNADYRLFRIEEYRAGQQVGETRTERF